MKIRLLIIFVLGLICGGLIWNRIFPEPVFTFTAKAKMDVATHEDSLLEGAYIDCPGLYYGRIMLSFPDHTKLDMIDKTVKVTGPLRTERLSNGEYLAVLIVQKIE